MTAAVRLRQVWTIARLQLSRVFFSKRSFWIYGLALFPSLIFLGNGIRVKVSRDRWAPHAISPAILESVREGDTVEEVQARAGKPINSSKWNRGPRNRGPAGARDDDANSRRYMMYFDGKDRWDLDFEAEILHRKRRRPLVNFEEDRLVFAGVFQYFYLRLAVFFGCLGIFINLFRGEMLDKTLHFWFLAPARREVLLAGKYLAGLIVVVLIFSVGAVLCFGALLWPQDAAQLDAFWRSQGMSHLFWYAAAAALAGVGYGSVFLAAGLLLRNPIIPAISILFWEGINGILPSMLQKVSVLYYAQSLCPVPAPIAADAPLLIRLLAAPAEPATPAVAVLGIIGITLLVLWAASGAVRRLEINYGTE